MTKDIYIGTVPICFRETRTTCTTVGPLASRHYVTASLPTSYDELATYEDNDDIVDYSSPPSGVSRLSLIDFIAATAVQAPGVPVAGPSAPAMAALLHAPPPQGPPPYEARPPPFAPGHDDTSTERRASSSERQQQQQPRESNIPPTPPVRENLENKFEKCYGPGSECAQQF